MDLSRFKELPSDVPWIAVFLERMPPGNLHTGIVYRDEKGQLHRLHFGWHHLLIHKPCTAKVACAIPVIDPKEFADEMFLAGFCGRIGRSGANKKIPYNLKIDNDVEFDTRTGAIKIGGAFTGLSCSTFTITVFRSGGNPIVDTSNWPPPDAEDIAAQQSFIDALAQAADEESRKQAAGIVIEVGTPRARPEHVAGACLEESYPVGHSTCDLNGKVILPIMDGWAGTQPPSTATPSLS